MFSIQKISPVVWTIAGSDSGGGAGVQADLKTLNAFKVHGGCVLTSITAQNPNQVIGIELVDESMVVAQMTALREELSPAVVKIGMLGSAECARVVSETLTALKAFVVCDPVLVASSGTLLTNTETRLAIQKHLFPITDLLTPNLPEARTILGIDIETPEEIEAAARKLLELGPKSVLIKGGHRIDDFSRDFWTDGDQQVWLSSYRVPSAHTHGTGCTLSSAIAAGIALGMPLLDSLVMAKAYLNRGLRTSYRIAKGSVSLMNESWPLHAHPDDLPWITPGSETGRRPAFEEMGEEPIGFYPVVDRANWVKRLLPHGVRTVQLRIKDLEGTALENEVREAIQATKNTTCRLFINDHWELALKYEAYGVHLGQNDIPFADISALQKSGIRLGVSTHSYEEVARAHAIRPSYITVGPIYQPLSKDTTFPPQGISGLRLWRTLLDYPIVAIGGIRLENAPELIAAGADGLAMITDIVRSENVEERAKGWVGAFGKPRPVSEKPTSLN